MGMNAHPTEELAKAIAFATGCPCQLSARSPKATRASPAPPGAGDPRPPGQVMPCDSKG